MSEMTVKFHRFPAALLLLLGLGSLAHGDTAIPLYVAEHGTDSGDCSNRDAPCRSLGYALQVAGKNAQIRVGPGRYAVDDPEDLIYMLSGALSVRGGYALDSSDGDTDVRASTFTGVPPGYRELVRDLGFVVIADQKSSSIERTTRARALLQTYQEAQVSAAAETCVNGSAAGFACNNIDLLAHVARSGISAAPSSALDIWGFVDLNTHREYALVGVSNGTAVFDVTDPEAPVEIGFVDGQRASWRDIKVYQLFDSVADRWRAYAYVTTDGASDGLFVIDLSGLPHSIRRINYTSDFSNAHNVFLTNTDYGTGLALPGQAPALIAAGSGVDSGQFRSYNLVNPTAPAFEARAAAAGYMHDAAALRISDQRSAQCANATATCNVLVDFNEDRLEFWDVTNSSAPSLLSRADRYANTGYVHSGWPTEDQQFVFAHDEGDETVGGLATTVRVFSLADLTNPTLVGSFTGPTNAIDHNGFVRGNRYYMSNYSRGLTVLDISNPAAPIEAGFFDTYGANDNAVFAGAWGAYPYFHSGTVAVSDINSGLYLLRDQTRTSASGRLSFTAPAFGVAEGQQAELGVSRNEGSTGAVSVDYEIVPATLDDTDFQAVSGTLSWAAGDTASQVLRIDALTDALTEGIEHAIIRLISPTGGATLGDMPVTQLYVGDASETSSIGLFEESIAVAERGSGLAILVLQRDGSPLGSASIDYAVTPAGAEPGVDYNGPVQGSVTWADGDALPKSIEFALVDDGVGEADEQFLVTLANAQGAVLTGSDSASVTILDGSGSNATPFAVASPGQTIAAGQNVTLNGSQSSDPDGDALSYQWIQIGGPTVSLQGADTAVASFTAPAVTSDTLLQFQLEVTDSTGLSATATTAVTITQTANPPGAGGNNNGGGGGGGAPWLPTLAMLLAAAGRRASRKDCA